jgi:hypothetical protein
MKAKKGLLITVMYEIQCYIPVASNCFSYTDEVRMRRPQGGGRQFMQLRCRWVTCIVKDIYLNHAPPPPREEVFMEGPIEPNMGPSLADVLLCTFESTNAGFSLFPVSKLLC